MDLKVMLLKDHVLLHVEAANRRDLLTAMAQPLVKGKFVADQDQFLMDVERREDQITTQIGRNIAIPHARSTTVRRLCLTVAIADGQGIAFSPQARNRCNLFFLIGIPALSPTAHLTLLQLLVHFANDAKRMEKLLASATPSQVVQNLTSFKPPT